ncbi:MAG TPA: alpha/beta fold hydrolase [Rhodospirillaceae bacterium]|nr:alpha/beta fold hydrolase [Rhodospirillaceae bacterium]
MTKTVISPFPVPSDFGLRNGTGDFSTPIAAADFLIPSQTPGIELFLRNKHLPRSTGFGPDRTILYVHGATLPAETVFDLPIDGLSWADHLALNGWDVWLVNIRGYGHSTWPNAMRLPADANPPVSTTEEAVADFTAAVNFIRAERRLDSLQLLGWSWGTVIAGSFAARFPAAARALVLVTPLWAHPDPATAPAYPKTAWQEWTLAESRRRSQTGVPPDQADAILPASTVALWEQAVRTSQPPAAERVPEVFRSPTGVLADPAWRGQAPYDPGAIIAPTLIIRGEWDNLTPGGMSLGLFDRLKSARLRSLTEIPRASHFVMAETGRTLLFDEVQAFLTRV